jgi:hypothetical protein
MPVASASPHDDNRAYPNWGILFENLGGVENGYSLWHHTMAIEWLALPIPEIHIPQCPTTHTGSICTMVQQMVTDLKNDTLYRFQHIQETMAEIKDIIPVSIHLGRRKRGLFNPIGSIAKSLFGLATQGDITEIQLTLPVWNRVKIWSLINCNGRVKKFHPL